MKYWLSIILLIFITNGVFSQFNNSLFSFKKKDVKHEEKALFASISSLNFMKNNEYNDSYLKGYTLIGTILRPTLNYTITDNLMVDAGVQMLINSGRDEMTYKALVWKVKYNATPSLSFTFGSLDYSNRHQLIDPIYGCENFITEKPETGLAIALSKWNFDAETWVNWEQYLLQGDPFQEIFTFGLSTTTRFINTEEIALTIPFQLLARHHGGEIDTSTDPMETLLNSAIGINLMVNNDNRIINKFTISGYGLNYSDVAATGKQKFSNGNAMLINAGIMGNYGALSASYWNGKKFIAPKGDIVYQSTIMSNGLDSTEIDRSLIIGRYFFDKEITQGANFGIEFNGIYDLQTTIFSYNYGFYLKFSLDFLLKDFSK